MTEEAKITGIYTEDPSCVPQIIASRPNVISQRSRGARHEVFFHSNPAHSNVPSGRELRRLLDGVEMEKYEPPVQGEVHAEVAVVHEDEEEETGSEEEEEARNVEPPPVRRGPLTSKK